MPEQNPLERGPKEKSKTDMVFDNMDALLRSAGVGANWEHISESLRKANFSEIDDLRSSIAEAVENERWGQALPAKSIMVYVDKTIKMIKAWQEKQ